MIRREYDPHFINRIANSTDVRPFIDHLRVDGPLDLSPAVGWATQTGVGWYSNGEDALAAFEQVGDRIYNGHLMFAATCRGARALSVAREILDAVSRYVDEVWGLVPLSNRRARWFARAIGFESGVVDSDPRMGLCETLVWRPQ